ncbi:OsmC family protein [Persicobacter psychrovividus]|uniref:Peroxiredoxin n=1 Tax=Persicobacter psychrovividus TaxID=387638 RepID=A0ABM7VF11_9BACT|nr:peroxiredoxin [Persicobacter psychrovividus]
MELYRLDDAYHMKADNGEGNTIELDGSPEIGGKNQGMRPMQLLLAAVAGCSSIDVISILKKQRQPLQDLKVSVSGERSPEGKANVWTKIHLHYKAFGELDAAKVEKAVKLSNEEYCSVGIMLSKTAEITYSFEILPA